MRVAEFRSIRPHGCWGGPFPKARMVASQQMRRNLRDGGEGHLLWDGQTDHEHIDASCFEDDVLHKLLTISDNAQEITCRRNLNHGNGVLLRIWLTVSIAHHLQHM